MLGQGSPGFLEKILVVLSLALEILWVPLQGPCELVENGVFLHQGSVSRHVGFPQDIGHFFHPRGTCGRRGTFRTHCVLHKVLTCPWRLQHRNCFLNLSFLARGIYRGISYLMAWPTMSEAHIEFHTFGVPLLPTFVSCHPKLFGFSCRNNFSACIPHGCKIHWQEKNRTEEICIGHYLVSPSCLSGKHGYLALAPLRGGNADRALPGFVALSPWRCSPMADSLGVFAKRHCLNSVVLLQTWTCFLNWGLPSLECLKRWKNDPNHSNHKLCGNFCTGFPELGIHDYSSLGLGAALRRRASRRCWRTTSHGFMRYHRTISGWVNTWTVWYQKLAGKCQSFTSDRERHIIFKYL